jgi:hypothetical protein
MFEFTESPHLDALDRAINEVFTDMNSITTDDEKYDKMSSQLVKLLKLREELTNKQNDYVLKENELDIKRQDANLKYEEFELKKEEFQTKPKISYETWATIGANLLGIGMILMHERAHVVATKALGFVSKLK